MHLALPLFFLSALLFFSSSALAARDSDRDGLPDRRERKLGTNPKRADTDRDGLRDGREVLKTRTNPKRADTDGDGLRDGRETKLRSSPLRRDSDGDAIGDRLERRGRMIAPTGRLLRLRDWSGESHRITIGERTFLAGPDRNGDGFLSGADFARGTQATLSWNSAQTELRALRAPGATAGAVSGLTSEGFSVGGRAALFSPDTFWRLPDINANGQRDAGDLQEGMRARVFFSASGVALSVEVLSRRDAGLDWPNNEEEIGEVVSVSERKLVLRQRGAERSYSTDSATGFIGQERSKWSDVQVGDPARVQLGGGRVVLRVLFGPAARPPGAGQTEFRGTLRAETVGWSVQTFSRRVPFQLGQAEIQFPDRNLDGRLDSEDLLPGDKISVLLGANGRASRVRLEDGPPLAEEISFQAIVLPPITNAPAQSISLRTPLGDIPFPVDEGTIFDVGDRNSDGRANKEDFVPGDVVAVLFDTRVPRIGRLALLQPSPFL